MSTANALLILIGSPRRNGNSATLAHAVERGAKSAGHEVTVGFVDDYITAFLRDCRTCRRGDGSCGIEDRFAELFFDHYLPARAVVFATPVYWYGMSGQLKTFLDRTFCYYAASHPRSSEVVAAMSNKRIGLVLSSEETYPGASLGIVHQIQEFTRYTRSVFTGLVRGVGNSRGEVARDPSDPVHAAEQMGRGLFERSYSDYHIDTPRSGRVWGQ